MADSRTFFRYIAPALLAVALGVVDSRAAQDAGYDLTAKPAAGQLQRVEAVLEVRGELKLNAEGAAVTRIDLEAEGRLSYDERWLTVSDSPFERYSARYYREAQGNVRIGKGALKPELQPDHRTVVAHARPEKLVLYCPEAALERDEAELLEIPGDSLLVDGILPTARVTIGEQWKPDDQRLASLLNLDVITQADVQCKLTSVEGDVALIEMQGTVTGAVNGVASEISLQAKANYHLGQKMVTWFAVALKENRAIGHAEPGFEVTARLRLAAAPLEQSPELADQRLEQLKLASGPETELLESRSKDGFFRVMLDRRWHVMAHRFDKSILRFVDGGDLIAQCNIAILPDLEAGREITLEEFQEDVKRALGDRLSLIVEVAQSTTDDGKRVLRVLASGNVAEIPIHWVYYHVTGEAGRRIALAFTLEAALVERFAEADRTVVETLDFLPRPAPAETAERTDGAIEQR